jgi:hypothetical protein
VKKIPTLFVRDPADMSRVLPEVHPQCGWVLAGEGVARRKYDGTCVLLRDVGGELCAFARREVKRGRGAPPGFDAVETDPATGKMVGWEPAEQSGYARYIDEALARCIDAGVPLVPGTYELCGPKVQGNPEDFAEHTLVYHAAAERFPDLDRPPADDAYRFLSIEVPRLQWEGIVWHHPDGRMAKLKGRDFRE